MNSAARSPHVLLVDDAPDIRELLCEVLEEEGYRVTSAATIRDISEVRELAPDLIVHDLLFSEHSPTGWSFLQTLREDPLVGQVPVILCTADCRVRTDPSWVQQVGSLGVRVVTKPFDLMEFLAILDAALPSPGTSALQALNA